MSKTFARNKRVSSAVALVLAAGLVPRTATAIGARPATGPGAPKGAIVATAPSATPGIGAFSPAAWTPVARGSINPSVFDLALSAASCAVRSGDVSNPSTLTVIDYSKPSTAKRLWIYDLRSHALLYQELVAHGEGSGDNLPTRFSNQDATHRSSIGLFVTEDTYIGKNGYSLRLSGLDAGFNDHALARAIVMHGARYVSEAFARARGRLGRSWGCPALREGIVQAVIDRIKGGSLVFAYYPDRAWLKTSKFLGDCAAARS